MENSKLFNKTYYVWLVILSLIFTFIATTLIMFGGFDSFYPFLDSGISVKALLNMFADASKRQLLLEGIIIFAVCMCIGIAAAKVPAPFWRKVYKYRYVVAIVIFAVCVILGLSGSSISYWSDILPGETAESSGVLFHRANPYRSDEFAVNTVLAIAQGENPYQTYPYFSEIVRGTTTDMFIVYGQPVLDYGIIFRPFQIGYLLFGSSRGLSFFWVGRMIALIMVSFEFGMLFTKKNKPLSAVYSALLSLSPLLCWWFAINGLVEMLVFGQLCCILIAKYMSSSKWVKKLLYAVLFFWSGGCYILVFYPAWQVCLGYVFLVLFIWVIVEHRKDFKWKWKEDLPILIIAALLIGGLLLSLLYRSWDTISAVMNTAYPGKRVSTEKFNLLELFSYGYNLFLPFVQCNGGVSWVLIDFFPLGLILAIYLVVFKKKRDVLLIGLFILEAILLIIYTLPVPVILIKLTLLSQVPAMRIIVAFGFINILMLIRSVALLCAIRAENREILSEAGTEVFATKCWKKFILIIIAGIYALCLCYFTKQVLTAFSMTKLMYVGVIVFFGGAAFILLNYRNRPVHNLLMAGMCSVIVLSGLMVNPVQKGTEFIYDNQLIQKINKIAKEDDGKWITDGLAFPANNIPLLAGAATINSTNVYPQMDTWKLIDEYGKYEEIYNRYAHINAEIVPEEQKGFELIQPDYFHLKVSVEDLLKLKVSYILTTRELDEFSNDNVTLQKVDSCGQYYVYEVKK